jgi:hypothetical protein
VAHPLWEYFPQNQIAWGFSISGLSVSLTGAFVTIVTINTLIGHLLFGTNMMTHTQNGKIDERRMTILSFLSLQGTNGLQRRIQKVVSKK